MQLGKLNQYYERMPFISCGIGLCINVCPKAFSVEYPYRDVSVVDTLDLKNKRIYTRVSLV